MSFFAGASRFIAPHKYELSRDELERQAQIEIQARIERGRPGPEEAARRGPRPAWTLPSRSEPAMETRRVDVVAVDLNVLRPKVTAEVTRPTEATEPIEPTAPTESTGRPRRRTAVRG